MKFNKIQSAILALLFVAATAVQAIEITPPTTVLSAVGSAPVGTPNGFKSVSFLASGYTAFAITNSGTGTLVTNDFGITNLIGYTHLVPGSGFLSTATYVTNGYISPYWYLKDGGSAIYTQTTAKPAWGDVPVWPDANGAVSGNTVISVSASGQASTTTNTDTFYFVKSCNGQFYDTNQIFSFSLQMNGTNAVSTNAIPPASFLTGARSIRLLYISAGTNAPTTTNFIHDISLNGTGR